MPHPKVKKKDRKIVANTHDHREELPMLNFIDSFYRVGSSSLKTIHLSLSD